MDDFAVAVMVIMGHEHVFGLIQREYAKEIHYKGYIYNNYVV